MEDLKKITACNACMRVMYHENSIETRLEYDIPISLCLQCSGNLHRYLEKITVDILEAYYARCKKIINYLDPLSYRNERRACQTCKLPTSNEQLCFECSWKKMHKLLEFHTPVKEYLNFVEIDSQFRIQPKINRSYHCT